MGANTLTPRQYQAKWTTRFELEQSRTLTPTTPTSTTATTITATITSAAPTAIPAGPAQPGSCVGGSTTPIDGDWALPGPRAHRHQPAGIDGPRHDYPAWDWIIPQHPHLRRGGGRVDRSTTGPATGGPRLRRAGRPGCDSCVVGVTIVDDNGYRGPTARHRPDLPSAILAAGQQVLWSGDTGRSGARTSASRSAPTTSGVAPNR